MDKIYGDIKVGDKVKLINPKSVKHFEVGGLSVIGTVEKIDQSHFVGRHRRPYFVRFDDHPLGLWSYAYSELLKID